MDISARLEFLDITDETAAALQRLQPQIETGIDELLNGFYRKMLSVPELAALFPGGSVEHAKAAQRRHWQDHVFAGRFDEAYGERVKRIGQAHERVGLEPHWYMAGYCHVLTELVEHVANSNRFSQKRMVQAMQSLIKAVFLDMGLSVSVYMTASRDQARSVISNHAQRFEGDVKGMVDLVAAAATELRAIAEGMATVADETATRTRMVASNADIASTNVETVAAAATQLSASIDEIGHQALSVREAAAGAVNDVSTIRNEFSALATAVGEISDATRLVNEIAGHTRMLALNAAIEATRAGEQGRGFAVVAEEVKALALQTAAVTTRISAAIDRVERLGATAAASVEHIAIATGRLHGVAAAIAAAVEEQGAATSEIARSVALAADGTRGMTTVIGEVATAATETGSSAENVLASSHALSSNAEQLSRKVGIFLDDVRQAA